MEEPLAGLRRQMLEADANNTWENAFDKATVCYFERLRVRATSSDAAIVAIRVPLDERPLMMNRQTGN